MLTPKQLQEIVERMQPVLDELNNWIVRDIVKRVMARLNNYDTLEVTPSSQWQAEVMIDAGGHLEDLQQELRTFTGKSDKELRRVFQEAGLDSYEADADVMRQGGEDVPPLCQAPRMQKIIEDTYQRTKGELSNYTRTTAVKSQQELISALDRAHIRVMSGATSYNEAVRETVLDLAEHQAQVVYPTGHVDTLEVAVLRAVRTGTAQASGNMTMEMMNQHKWDIVLTSAHLGARYGDGGENPGNHSWWQGKFFSVSGKDERFPPFIESTGYGTGEGLCGWNCRHSFGPGDGEHNPWTQYDKEENKKAYDLSQTQRKQERDIRKQKRKVMALKEAIDNCTDPEMKRTLLDAYTAEYDKLGNMNARYNSFCDENGLPRLADRLQVAEWNYKEAMKMYKEATPQNTAVASPSHASATSAPAEKPDVKPSEETPKAKSEPVSSSVSSQSENPEKKDLTVTANDGTMKSQEQSEGLKTADNARAWIQEKGKQLGLRIGQQQKHRTGTHEYVQAQELLKKKGQFGPSELKISDEEIVSLVNKYGGTGIIRIRDGKEWNKSELIIDNDTIVGDVINNLNNQRAETSVFKIHYSDSGYHIVPDYPSKKRR